jgi:hypothetical protein
MFLDLKHPLPLVLMIKGILLAIMSFVILRILDLFFFFIVSVPVWPIDFERLFLKGTSFLIFHRELVFLWRIPPPLSDCSTSGSLKRFGRRTIRDTKDTLHGTPPPHLFVPLFG